jgi:hypothetical protein
VSEKKKNRYFTAQYKLRILSEVDACKSPGEIGAVRGMLLFQRYTVMDH